MFYLASVQDIWESPFVCSEMETVHASMKPYIAAYLIKSMISCKLSHLRLEYFTHTKSMKPFVAEGADLQTLKKDSFTQKLPNHSTRKLTK